MTSPFPLTSTGGVRVGLEEKKTFASVSSIELFNRLDCPDKFMAWKRGQKTFVVSKSSMNGGIDRDTSERHRGEEGSANSLTANGLAVQCET